MAYRSRRVRKVGLPPKGELMVLRWASLALVLLWSASVSAQVSLTSDLGAPKVNARVDVSQMYTLDNVTDRHLNYSEVRGVLDATSPFGLKKLELHIDLRGRLGWNAQTRNRYRITHAYVQYGSAKERWFLGLGRMNLTQLLNAQIDGVQAGFRIAEGAVGLIFAGLLPHPVTRELDVDFSGAGLGYQQRSKSFNSSGGLMLQMYKFELDRVFLSERVLLRHGRAFTAQAQVVVDFLAPSGAIAEQIDVTNANLTLRYAPSRAIDFTLTGSHVHSILPNLWWEDWIAQERVRRGFTIDGPAPVGSRRSNARLTTNLHFGALSPYVALRYDHRHEDAKDGYEGMAGLKLGYALGYLNLFGAYRSYFGAENILGAVQGGVEIVGGLNLDAGFSALMVRPQTEGASRRPLYDANASLWFDFGAVSEVLKGIYTLGMYQAFVDDDLIYHMAFVRLGYRFRS